MDDENESALDLRMTDWQWAALNDTGQLCLIQSWKNSPYNGKACCTSIHIDSQLTGLIDGVQLYTCSLLGLWATLEILV